jgi:hypothetical protein
VVALSSQHRVLQRTNKAGFWSKHSFNVFNEPTTRFGYSFVAIIRAIPRIKNKTKNHS